VLNKCVVVLGDFAVKFRTGAKGRNTTKVLIFVRFSVCGGKRDGDELL